MRPLSLTLYWEGAEFFVLNEDDVPELLDGLDERLPDGTTLTLRLVRVLLGWRELQALRDGKPFSRLTAPGMGRARITWSAFLFVGGTSLLAELGSRAGVG